MPIYPILNASFTTSGTVVEFEDETGDYTVTTNEGGYGAPNDVVADVTLAEITITYPNGETQVIDVTNELVAGTPSNGIPFTDVTLSSVQDGIYTFLYSVTSPSGTVTSMISKISLSSLKCCLDKMWAEVPEEICSSCQSDEYIDKVLFAQGLYNSIIAMGGCGNLTRINNVIEKLQVLCGLSNCNCN